MLVAQVVGGVRWEDSMRRMMADGFDTFYEVGPGRVLTGLLKRIDRKTGQRSEPIGAPQPNGRRKHPVLAANAKGEILFAWTEGMGWSRGGAVAWQLYDADGKPTGVHGRSQGVPTWSLVAACTRPDGSFVILY